LNPKTAVASLTSGVAKLVGKATRFTILHVVAKWRRVLPDSTWFCPFFRETVVNRRQDAEPVCALADFIEPRYGKLIHMLRVTKAACQ
jgi:hypothetical protein